MLINSIKFFLLGQAYVGTFFVMSWWHHDLQFAPWWLKTLVFIVVCVFLAAPLFWMYFDNEEKKEKIRLERRLDYLEKHQSR